MSFESDSDITALTAAFRACNLPKEKWTHAAHWAAALALIAEDEAAAHRDMPGMIRAYNESVGGRNTDTEGYHETITIAKKPMLSASPEDVFSRIALTMRSDLVAGEGGLVAVHPFGDDRCLNRETRPHQTRCQRFIRDLDPHGNALDDLGEVAGGRVHRDQAELASGRWGDGIQGAGHFQVRIGIDVQVNFLAFAHALNLGLLEVRDDIGFRYGNDRHGLLAGAEQLAFGHDAVGNDPVKRSAELRPGRVQFRRIDAGLSCFDLSFGACNGSLRGFEVFLGAVVISLGHAQFALRGGDPGIGLVERRVRRFGLGGSRIKAGFGIVPSVSKFGVTLQIGGGEFGIGCRSNRACSRLDETVALGGNLSGSCLEVGFSGSNARLGLSLGSNGLLKRRSGF